MNKPHKVEGVKTTENPMPRKVIPASAPLVPVMRIRQILDRQRVPYQLSQEVHTHGLWEFSDPKPEQLSLCYVKFCGKRLEFHPDYGYLSYQVN